MGAEMMTKADRDIKVPNNEGLFPVQSYGGDNHHCEGKDHQSHDRPDIGAALVNNTGVRLVRKKTPNIRYPSTDLTSAQTEQGTGRRRTTTEIQTTMMRKGYKMCPTRWSRRKHRWTT